MSIKFSMDYSHNVAKPPCLCRLIAMLPELQRRPQAFNEPRRFGGNAFENGVYHGENIPDWDK